MKKRNSILVLVLSALFFVACTQENDLRTGNPDVETVPAHISLTALPMENVGDLEQGKMEGAVTRAGKDVKDSNTSMDVTIGGEEPATRMTDVEEKALKTACVFQFDATTKKYLYSQFVASAAIGSNEISLAVNDGASEICVIANMGDLTTELASKLVATLTIDQFKALVTKTIATDAFSTELPMWGWKTGVTVSTASDVTVALKYMVAKVNFKAPVVAGITLTDIKVTLKQVAPEIRVDASTVIPTATVDYATISVTAAQLAAGTGLSWYIPENKQNAVAGCTNATLRGGDAISKTATYIEVSAKNGGADLIYQVYLGDGGATNFTVARGIRYNVTANIKGFNVNDARVLIGKDLSAEGMKTANCYMVPLAANTWYRFKGTVRGNGRGMGTGYPAADAFVPDNTLGTVGDANTTRVPGWKINANDLSGTGSNTPLSPADALILWQTATAEGTGTGLALTSAAWSKSGYVVFCTNGTATEGNAVIAARDAAKKIVWSWHIWKTAYTPDPANAATVQSFKVRNNTIASNAWVTNGAFKARTEKVMTRNLGAEHNNPAVAAAGDGKSGGLLYQWGRKDPFVGSKNFTDASAEVKNMPLPTIVASSYKWADGSTNASHDAARAATGEGTAAVLDAIANPLNFFIQKNATTYDWVSGTRANQNDNLWGNANEDPAPSQSQLPNKNRGAKSVYDPCPYGWRVAPQDTWTAFTKTVDTKFGGNNYGTADFRNWNVVGNTAAAALVDVQKKFTDNVGWTFYYDADGNGTTTGNTVYFPASGCCGRAAGGFHNIGLEGFYWYSSGFGIGNTHSGTLLFHSTLLNPINISNRANGFSVRCVQE